jgi:hypothetical protein
LEVAQIYIIFAGLSHYKNDKMEGIAKIIATVSSIYDINMVELVAKADSNTKRNKEHMILMYMCYIYITENRTDVTFSDLSSLLHCSPNLICRNYEKVKAQIVYNKVIEHEVNAIKTALKS